MSLLSCQNLRHALFGPLNLSVAAGEVISISGASGIGKSLFLRCLADLEQHSGSIWLNHNEQKSAIEQSDFVASDWRKQVGLLPADSQWWFSFVGDHFAESNLAQFKLLGFDESTLEWRVDRLSSGEKQRLALLRLLVNQPSVLLLDEPTANLDAKLTLVVEKFLVSYARDNGRALIWVTHDHEQAKRVATRQCEFTRKELIFEHGLT